MLRALGMNKTYVIIMVIAEASIFSIPAMFVAFIIAYLLNIVICIAIFEKTTLAGQYFLYTSGILYGLIVGIIMPIISNIFPIQRALSKTLRDGLSLLRHTLNEISVKIIRLTNMGISLTQLILALSLLFCGFTAYYIVPLSLYYKNFEAFAFVMNLIFIAMIIGMIILSNFLVSYIERIILYIILFIFRKDNNLKPVVISNLKGHKKRNLKTSLMYSIALA